MSKINGQKVRLAGMKNNIFVPGHGEIKKELSGVSNAGNKGIDMVIDEPFLLLTIEHKQTKLPFSVAVALSELTHLVLAEKPAEE